MMTFVSILTIGITLFFLAAAYLGFSNLNGWINQYNRTASIVAYLQLDLDTTEEQSVLEVINRTEGVDSTLFISRSDASRIFASLYGKKLLSSVKGNPFPASVEIDPVEDRPVSTLEKSLLSIAGVESVSVSRKWISSLNKVKKHLLVANGILSLIILLPLFYTITNTIKLTMYARRELIVNMQYVGASRLYIRTPFILEGMIQGLSGAFIAWCGIRLIALTLTRFPIYWGGNTFLPIILSVGLILGFTGSIQAIRKLDHEWLEGD